eukprot:7248914-Prymnesium_polylepis.1
MTVHAGIRTPVSIGRYMHKTAVRVPAKIPRITSVSAAISSGTPLAASSTMIMPAAPPPAWIAVEPW